MELRVTDLASACRLIRDPRIAVCPHARWSYPCAFGTFHENIMVYSGKYALEMHCLVFTEQIVYG
ncbi:hypothetical protein CFB43_18980 [Burkholderia sp. AU15512]|nr:hypothetical protein CFB43_18980 [Burkholderia sp. AU15512]